MSTLSPAETISNVRSQYEFLPYPARNPADEANMLHLTSLDELAAINHFGFAGRKDFRKGFRALVAGGGTGDSVVYLAEQLANTPGKILYVDLSSASLKIAQARIAARGLQSKVTWVQGSLLDLPLMNPEPFDFINCSGVLHHLPDPQSGLAALKSVLKPDGVMGLMVYGEYGRSGVYQIQDLLRILCLHTDNQAEKLAIAKRLLPSLPPSNVYASRSNLFQPLAEMGDSEMYDLFLHSQDRAYSVPQLYEFLDTAGLTISAFAADNRAWYRPTLAIQDADLLALLEALPLPLQQSACELFWGSTTKHSFWATAKPDTVALWSDSDNVPSYGRTAEFLDLQKKSQICTDAQFEVSFKKGETGPTLELAIDNTPLARAFLRLVNGQRTTAEIVTTLATEIGEPEQAIGKQCGRIFDLLNLYDLMLLRHKSVPAAPNR